MPRPSLSHTTPHPSLARTRVPFILLLSTVIAAIPAGATEISAPERLFVAVQKSLILDLGEKVETVSITDTELADFVVAAKTQVLIHGKKEGTTSLVVWAQGGNYKRYDLVVRRGYATKQIKLNVRVAELTESALREFGIDYLARSLSAGVDQAAGVYSGGVGRPSIPLAAGSLPEFNDMTQIGLRWFKGDERYSALIQAMAENGTIKILARPNLVCLDGEEASFLAGGEFPIPVAQTSSIGGTTVTIEWREFGVKLNFLPTIVDSTLINLKVEPEVSNLDFNNAVSIGGFVIPSLQTRRASTHVELNSGEYLILGGLRSTTERKIESKIPILGDIPLLGHFFRSKTRVQDENELLIVISPEIIEPGSGAMPKASWETPPDAQESSD